MIRVAQGASDELVRLGVSSTSDLALTTDDLARISTSAPGARAGTDDLARAATHADQSPTWRNIQRGLRNVVADEQLIAEVQEAVRKGATETACNSVLYGTVPTFEGFSANVIKNGPMPPALQMQLAWQDTLALSEELREAYVSGDAGQATVLVFCAVATG